MTVASEISRLQTAKSSIKTSIENKGVTVPSETKFDGYSQLIDTISSGEWAPDPTWPQNLATWTPSGGIGFIMSNASYGKVSFIVDTASANYTVVVNDGTSDISTTSYASGAQCDVSITAGDGTTYYAVKITSTSNITRFRVVKTTLPATGQVVPILYWYGNLTTLTDCSRMFYPSNVTAASAKCSLLQASYVLSTANVTDMSYQYYYCVGLQSVTKSIDCTNLVNASYMYGICVKLKNISTMTNPNNLVNLDNVLQNCYSLKNTPTISISSVTTMNNYLDSAFEFYMTTLDLSSGSALTKLYINNTPGLKGLTVSSTAPWGTNTPQIDITNCGLDRAALIALFNSLGTVTSKTIKITGNIGVPELTATDLLIATNKGWTVTTA